MNVLLYPLHALLYFYSLSLYEPHSRLGRIQQTDIKEKDSINILQSKFQQ